MGRAAQESRQLFTEMFGGEQVHARLRGKVEHIVFAGARTHVHLRVGEVALQAMVPNGASDLQLVEGGEIGVEIAPEALRVLPN